jgi:hypothetical protein
MNSFKKLNDKLIIDDANFPILSSNMNTNSNSSINFLNIVNKKNNEPDLIEKDNVKKDWCTIYYDKELKKIIYENFPNKTYNDSDTNSETNSESEIDSIDLESSTSNTKNVQHQKNKNKNMKLHNDMNRAIKIIMENRDKFIDQYGVDEFIRDYLPKDSIYLYSRYYYKNKYMNYYKNKVNNNNYNYYTVNDNNKNNIQDSDSCPIDELDIIRYEDIEIEDDYEDINEDDIDNDDEII